MGLLRKIATIAIVLSAAVPAAHAYDFVKGGIYYTIAGNKKSVSVTYADLQNGTYKGNVVIPTEVTNGMTTYPVKAIEGLAFMNSASLESVTIPDGVTQIGDQAFSHCYSLRDVKLSAKLQRIGDFAFEYCEDLPEITIPASVTQIGYAVFTYCRSLSGFNVEEGNPVYTAVDGILYTKTMKSLVQYPAAKTDYSFEIPATVTIMPDCAFSPQPYLESLSIGPALGLISDGALAECAILSEITVDPDNKVMESVDGVLFNKGVTRLIQYPVCHPAVEYEMPSTVEELGDLSMLGALYIHKLDLPESLRTIGIYSLIGCSGLEQVICHAVTPPACDANPINPYGIIFDDEVYAKASLQVPQQSVAAYKANAEWGRFAVIYEIGGSSLDTVEADDKNTEVYDLLGRRMDPAARGLRIINGRKLLYRH